MFNNIQLTCKSNTIKVDEFIRPEKDNISLKDSNNHDIEYHFREPLYFHIN